MKKFLIIGGVAGGATAAARLRRLDEHAEIILFEKDGDISFANCGLPYYVGNVIPDREDLLLQTPESFNARYRVDVRVHSEVTRVDSAAKLVYVRSSARGEYTESYDALLLAPGSSPVVPQAAAESPRVYTVRNVPDVDRIQQALSGGGVSSAIVVGGGFIGVEMAENLRERGLDVSLVGRAPHVIPRLDDEMALFLEKELEAHGVSLCLGDGLSAMEDRGDTVEVTLQSGRRLSAEAVILALGVRPATGFLRDSGIELTEKGHIVVDEYLRTSAPEVYAVGDAVETTDFLTGARVAVPLAGPANRQARLAADAIAGRPQAYTGIQGSGILKVFGLTAAFTGQNEKALKRSNIRYHAVWSHPFSHATYYPGAVQLAAKLLFDESGKVLGCQMVGADMVDKRVDVVAAAMRFGATAADLAALELCYAPPYSSAKDPVNMLGYMALDVLDGLVDVVSAADSAELGRTGDMLLLDVRTVREFRAGHLPGAVNIPVDELRERLGELDRARGILIYCQVGMRGYIASRILAQNGFAVRNMSGGFKSYAAAALPSEKED